MRTTIATSFEELESLSSHWQRLAAHSEFRSICLNYSFIRAWWHAFGPSLSLRAVIIEDESNVRLIAPFYANHADRQLRCIGDFWGDYNSILFARGDRESVSSLRKVLQSDRDWSKLLLTNLPTDSALIEPFRSAPQSWAPLFQRVVAWSNFSKPPASLDVWENVPYVDLSARPEYQRLLVDDRWYRRHLNWFNRQGRLKYECFTDRDACLGLLDKYFDMHRKEWTTRHQSERASADSTKLSRWFGPEESAPSSPLPLYPTRKFFRCLVEELCPLGVVRFDLLSLDGRPVAMHFGFNEHGRLYYYKAAYDHEFQTHAPGRLLIGHMLQQAIESGLAELDFGLGLHPYKLDYATGVRRTATLTMYRTASDAAREQLDHLKGRLKVNHAH